MNPSKDLLTEQEAQSVQVVISLADRWSDTAWIPVRLLALDATLRRTLEVLEQARETPLFKAWGEFRKGIRQVLHEQGVRSNPGWSDEEVVMAFRQALAERNVRLDWLEEGLREIQGKAGPAGYDSGDSGILALATSALKPIGSERMLNALERERITKAHGMERAAEMIERRCEEDVRISDPEGKLLTPQDMFAWRIAQEIREEVQRIKTSVEMGV